MTENINEYIEYFKSQDLKSKKKIIYEQLQLLTSFTNNMCKELNIKNEIIINKELLDLKNKDYTEEDFAEAIIILVNSIQNSICDYVNGINNFLDKLDTDTEELEQI